MPIYEYECPGCGSRFDRRIAMADPDPACPNCGGSKVRRLISVFAATGSSSPTSGPAAREAGSGGCGCGTCACGAR